MNRSIDIIESDAQDLDEDFKKLLLLFWARKWIILSVGIVCSLIGFGASQLIARTYSAHALVQLEKGSNGIAMSDDIADMLNPESEANTEVEIIKSRLVLDSVVVQQNLEVVAVPRRLPLFGNLQARMQFPFAKPELGQLQKYAWNGAAISVAAIRVPSQWLNEPITLTLRSAGRFDYELPDGLVYSGIVGEELVTRNEDFFLQVEKLTGQVGTQFIVKRLDRLKAVERIRGGLSVSEKSRDSGVLNIAMLSTDPDMSTRIVNSVVESYVSQNIGRSSAEAERSLAFLQEQLPTVQDQLRRAELSLNSYRLKNSSIDLNLETQAILERVVTLDAQLNSLSMEETELSRRFTRNHPDYKSLLDKRSRLAREKESLSASIQSLPSTQQAVLRLTRDVEVSQQIYLQLLNKSQELSVMKAGAVGNVRLLEEASRMPEPVNPKPALFAALAGMLGMVLVGLYIQLRSRMANEIDSPDDLRELAVPVYSVIPLSNFQSAVHQTRTKEGGLLAFERANEVSVEALRQLRTNLHFGLMSDRQSVVAITGPSPGVGKSFISANLAYLAAQSGLKVLLIDGDMRRGEVGRLFKIPRNAAGLSNVLSQQTTVERASHRINLADCSFEHNDAPIDTHKQVKTKKKKIKLAEYALDVDFDETTEVLDRHNSVSGSDDSGHSAADDNRASLTVMPRGPAPPNPSELLMHERFTKLVEKASSEYDLVVFDTPPVLAVTDALIISKNVGMTLMVVRHNNTTVHEAKQTIEMFSNNHGRITGLVLNGYNHKKGRYGKYGMSYGYQYKY